MKADQADAASQRVSTRSRRNRATSTAIGPMESTIPKQQIVHLVGPAQRTLMVASSCPIDYADDIPQLPRPDNSAKFERRHRRQDGHRLENGEPFVVTWLASVANLTISIESVTGANIEERVAKNESSMVMCR